LPESGKYTEQTWVEDVLEFKVEFRDKYEFERKNDSWIHISSEESSTIYACHILGQPKYCLIQTGNNITENFNLNLTHFLFKYNACFDLVIVNLAAFGSDYTIKNMLKLIYLAGYDDIVSTPEPSALLLLGSGFIGLSFVFRCRRRC